MLRRPMAVPPAGAAVPVASPLQRIAARTAPDLSQIRNARMMKDAESAMERSRTTAFKKGGSASKRADGCCTKGKTKGKMK